jgi:hypothetical protein
MGRFLGGRHAIESLLNISVTQTDGLAVGESVDDITTLSEV